MFDGTFNNFYVPNSLKKIVRLFKKHLVAFSVHFFYGYSETRTRKSSKNGMNDFFIIYYLYKDRQFIKILTRK